MTCAPRFVACPGPASERLLRAVAPFGLLVGDPPAAAPPRALDADIARLLAMPPGSIALITGPSGCGKSMLLRATAGAARSRGVRVVDATARLARAAADRPIIDLFTQPLTTTLRLLGAAGLGEPMLWARPAAALSEGQRARLGIALAMARATARRDTLLVIDECCSTLDRVTARCVARTLRRWCTRHAAVRVLCATAHDDLAAALEPDLELRPSPQEHTR